MTMRIAHAREYLLGNGKCGLCRKHNGHFIEEIYEDGVEVGEEFLCISCAIDSTTPINQMVLIVGIERDESKQQRVTRGAGIL